MIFRAVTKSPKLIIVPGLAKWQNAEHYFFFGRGGGWGAITKILREGEEGV